MLKLSLVCAVLFSGISTYAIEGNGDFALHVLKGNGKLVTFALNNVKKASLTIYDKEGSVIYYENASGTNGILRTFNLKEFPEGKYILEVDDNVKKVRHEIIIADDSSILSKNAISSVYKTNTTEKNTNVAVR